MCTYETTVSDCYLVVFYSVIRLFCSAQKRTQKHRYNSLHIVRIAVSIVLSSVPAL